MGSRVGRRGDERFARSTARARWPASRVALLVESTTATGAPDADRSSCRRRAVVARGATRSAGRIAHGGRGRARPPTPRTQRCPPDASRCSPRGSRQASPASIPCSKRSRSAATLVAATSSWAWAPHSSHSRARSTGCGLSVRWAKAPPPWCWPPPTPRRSTAERCPGPNRPGARGVLRAPSWWSSTARRPRTLDRGGWARRHSPPPPKTTGGSTTCRHRQGHGCRPLARILQKIDGEPAIPSALAPRLRAVGFVDGYRGLALRP